MSLPPIVQVQPIERSAGLGMGLPLLTFGTFGAGLIVDPHKRFLYLMMENGKALRYGVGVGKAGLEFSGKARKSSCYRH